MLNIHAAPAQGSEHTALVLVKFCRAVAVYVVGLGEVY